MGHASDCAVNDGPAYLPGPCSCGLDVGPVDPVEAFVPIVLVGAWRGRLVVRERNAETFIEAKQSKIFGRRGIRLRLDLIDPHSWPIFERGADHLNLNNPPLAVILKGKTDALLASLNRQRSISTGLIRIGGLRWLGGLWRPPPTKRQFSSHNHTPPFREVATTWLASPAFALLANLAGNLCRLRRRVHQSADKSGDDQSRP